MSLLNAWSNIPIAIQEIVANYLWKGQVLLCAEFLPQQTWIPNDMVNYLVDELLDFLEKVDTTKGKQEEITKKALTLLQNYQKDLLDVRCFQDTLPNQTKIYRSVILSQIGGVKDEKNLKLENSIHLIGLLVIDDVHAEVLRMALSPCDPSCGILQSWFETTIGVRATRDSSTRNIARCVLWCLMQAQKHYDVPFVTPNIHDLDEEISDAESENLSYLVHLDPNFVELFCQLYSKDRQAIARYYLWRFNNLFSQEQNQVKLILTTLRYEVTDVDVFNYQLVEFFEKRLPQFKEDPNRLFEEMLAFLRLGEEMQTDQGKSIFEQSLDMLLLLQEEDAMQNQNVDQGSGKSTFQNLVCTHKDDFSTFLPCLDNGKLEVKLAKLFHFDFIEFLSGCGNFNLGHSWISTLSQKDQTRVYQNIFNRASHPRQYNFLQANAERLPQQNFSPFPVFSKKEQNKQSEQKKTQNKTQKKKLKILIQKIRSSLPPTNLIQTVSHTKWTDLTYSTIPPLPLPTSTLGSNRLFVFALLYSNLGHFTDYLPEIARKLKIGYDVAFDTPLKIGIYLQSWSIFSTHLPGSFHESKEPNVLSFLISQLGQNSKPEQRNRLLDMADSLILRGNNSFFESWLKTHYSENDHLLDFKTMQKVEKCKKEIKFLLETFSPTTCRQFQLQFRHIYNYHRLVTPNTNKNMFTFEKFLLLLSQEFALC